MYADTMSIAKEDAGSILYVSFWIVQTATVAALLMTTGGRLVGYSSTVEMLAKVGLGHWLSDLGGGLEVAGLVGLLTTFASAAASLLLFVGMAGAVVAEVLFSFHSAVSLVVRLVATCSIAGGWRSLVVASLPKL